MPAKPFWELKPLAEMTTAEWESLCDGCGKCCLHKLEDEETGDVYYTDVACRYLSAESCRCTHYSERNHLVPECIVLTPADVDVFYWLPGTCAYRLVAEGKPLPAWHPLITGSASSVHAAGISVKGRVTPELSVHPDDYEEHIVHWVD